MEETRNAPYYNVEDRISKLPDNLILHIMSLVDIKYAVQTSVLSKRWIHTWKSLPILEFNRSSFPFGKEHDEKFVYFMDMVFILSDKTDIQRLSLRWFHQRNDDDIVAKNINRWMVHAVERNVQAITIEIGQSHPSAYELPHQLLNSKSLRKLNMKFFGGAERAYLILPKSMNLPQLRVLILNRLSISNVESSTRLLSSCPVLEKLFIYDCDIQTDNQRRLIVESLSLKEFVYSCYLGCHLRENDTMANTTIKLRAPSLEFFTWRSLLTQDCSLENCSSLSLVNFDMVLEEEDEAVTYEKLPSEEKVVHANRLMKFLGGIHMTKSMILSPGFLEVLSQSADLLDCQPPRLCNLLVLSLEMWLTRGCLRGIAYLLKISPKITDIYLVSKKSMKLVDIGDDWEAGLSSPGMLSHLRYVDVIEAEGCDAELQLLSFLLKHAMVLVKVALSFRFTGGLPDRVRQVEQFKKKLRAVPAASSCIKLVFN